MSIPKKPKKNSRNLFRRMWKISETAVKAVVNWILRGLLRTNKRPRLAKAGFALPTTVMVMLVVILLTASMVMRSFDRNRNAINARSEQVIQNTSTPALDRAQAKLAALLADPELPRGTPPDSRLFQVMQDEKYTFADETRLKVVQDLNGDGGIQTGSGLTSEDESLNTAWKYPVDTDGNGSFDSFTLYGIYWRNPPRSTGTAYDRERLPLEARSIPQAIAGLGDVCAGQGQTAATSIGEGDWFKQGGNLSKAFYTYAATVPINDLSEIRGGPFGIDKFERNTKADKAFAGLEYQQDRYRTGLNNIAVSYQDDLVIAPGGKFRLNGRVFTNGNLLAGGPLDGGPAAGDVRLYQVSSKFSCFYEEANGKINVGGNVGTGDISTTQNQVPVTVDLFKGQTPVNNPPDPVSVEIDGDNKSTISEGGRVVAYNDAAYNLRIALMRDTALSFCGVCTPLSTPQAAANLPRYSDADLKTKLTEKLTSNPSENYKILSDEIEVYLRNRTRRVPYAEIERPDGLAPDGTNLAVAPYTPDANNVDTSVFGAGGIEPPAEWAEPLDANTGLTLVENNLRQTNPETQQEQGVEEYIGDRINVGNNLPAYWKNSDGEYVSVEQADLPEGQQPIAGANWTDGTPNRYRTTQVEPLENLGPTDRGDFWEQAAGANPAVSTASGIAGGGGMRIITGAGLYVDDSGNGTTDDANAVYPRGATTSFLPNVLWDTRFVDPDPSDGIALGRIDATTITNGLGDPILVWPDTMPMTGGEAEVLANNRQGDLLMRATAVYHYASSQGVAQEPIACVSSYYDPTDSITARNRQGLPDVSGGVDTNNDLLIDESFNGGPLAASRANAKSNNGVVYQYPSGQRATFQNQLQRQARLVYPNGRLVNPALNRAMQLSPGQYSWQDYSAIDAAICSIAIFNGTAQEDDSVIPHGAIKESSFLDAREVKAIDKLTPGDPNYSIDNNYNLALEDRQPLEIRVTDINIGRLARTSYLNFDSNGDGTPEQEYLLPNSGIIYASRDDALPDNSTPGDIKVSATDFRLDPTRRPNGIRLINGLRLARGTGNDYRQEEKGLILATDIPAYVKGNFNLHLESGTNTFNAAGGRELEEFEAVLDDNAWANFYTRGNGGPNDLNTKFACRVDQPLCEAPGDQWRAATVIADAITLQSVNYQDGYRSQGDFELRNNAGTPLVGKRINQGFFENSFVTSADWWNPATGFPKNDFRSSYLVNGVTPIQRRATVIPFSTEKCTVIPVSECVNDTTSWVDDGDTSGVDTVVTDQRYPRRVAFKRTGGKYAYDTNGYPILKTPVPGTPLDNTLWFQTRETDGSASFESGPEPYIFQPLDPATGNPQLPDLGWLRGYAVGTSQRQAPFDPNNLGTPVVNTSIVGPGLTHSGETVGQRILKVLQQFDTTNYGTTEVFDPSDPNALDFTKPDPKTIELTGGGQMRVYDVPGNFTPTNPLIGDASSVFVFRVGRLTLQASQQVQLNNGVLPENVYWLVRSDVTVPINATLKGNVLTRNGVVTLGFNAKLEGRAFSRRPQGVRLRYANSQILAPEGNQPRLVPVTQIHSVSGTPGNRNDDGNVASNTALYGNVTDFPPNWLQQAGATNYNIAFVSGDSPLRPAEASAGLNNFVRFQENWQGRTARIKGSFIQQKRSSFATAPFATIRQGANQPAPIVTSADKSLSIFGYTNTRYLTPNGSPQGTLPYYITPGRQWGFDVGLLSQAPDIFSQKFTKDISKTQNYYRQVGRDDPWIETLLCAAEPTNPSNPDQRVGKPTTAYTNYAVPESQRPNCNDVVGVGIGAYPANP